MKRLLVLLMLTIFICESYSQVSKQLNGGGIYFLDTKTGWINWLTSFSEENVYKTTDGGLSWRPANLPITREWQTYFINKDMGFMIGSDGQKTKRLRSLDGGSSWEEMKDSSNYYTWNYYFLNTDIGYSLKFIENNGEEISGEVLLKSTNGGVTWNDLFEVPYPTLSFFVHNTDDITYAGGEVNDLKLISFGFVKRSKGNIYEHSFDYPFGDIYFLDSLKGFATSVWLYETTNGGITWEIIPDVLGGMAIFWDSLNGYIDGGYQIQKTTDGGKTWIKDLHVTPHWMQRCYVDSLNIFERDPYNDQQKFCKSTDGGYTWQCIPFNIVTSTNENIRPLTYSLEQNFPNPFNPSTTIKYSIKQNNQVTLKVYDVLGNLIKTLVDGYKSAGEYQTDFKAEYNIPSGIYFYTLKSGNYSETKKMILLK